MSSPKGALTRCRTSSPSNFHHGTVFTKASKVDHFPVRARCVNSRVVKGCSGLSVEVQGIQGVGVARGNVGIGGRAEAREGDRT